MKTSTLAKAGAVGAIAVAAATAGIEWVGSDSVNDLKAGAFFALGAFGLVIVACCVASIPGQVASVRRHVNSGAILAAGWLSLIGVVLPLFMQDPRFMLALALWPIALVWSLTDSEHARRSEQAADAGPGWFRVIGVDTATHMDTSMNISAASAANARAKVELRGVTVTSVERIEAPPRVAV